MKKVLSAIALLLLSLSLSSLSPVTDNMIAEGSQPQVAADVKGVIRVTFGHNDDIFCAASSDKGVTFSKPALVAHLPDMHLGMARGPQIASSANYSVITAMDKSGNIHWFRLSHSSMEWKSMGTINDLKGSAPEGLIGIAADKKDNFYAVWLDIRIGKNNQIYFSSLRGKESQWSKNVLAYRSPDGHVCECCQPHIAVQGSEVAIMFRNWLNGSRDLYFLRSINSGASFETAQKLGMDTWKLNGCPMDGGGIMINSPNNISTTWQRKGVVYLCKPGQSEIYVGQGRNSSISGTGGNPVLTFQNKDTVKVMKVKTKTATAVGNGDYLKSVLLPGNKVLCVWEQDNKIRYKMI